MSGALNHSPADIIRRLLVTLGKGVLPSAGTTSNWPIGLVESDKPDNCITVYDTAGYQDGRLMVDGEQQEHPGVQIRIRSATRDVGYAKANAIAEALDKSVYDNALTIGSDEYLVHSVSRTGTVIDLGDEVGISKRRLFTINAVVTLRKTS